MPQPNQTLDFAKGGDGVFRLTEKQEEARQLLSGPQTHTCLVGGARSGKTFIVVRQIMVRALKAPGSRHAILRFRGNAVRASIWLDTLPKVRRLCFPGVALTPKRQDGYVLLPNGSEIWMGGLDEKERVEKILGQEFASIFLNECSQIPYASVLIARTRLAQNIGLALRMFYDLNPTGKGHWTNKQFGLGLDPAAPLKALPDAGDYKRLFLNPRDNAANLPPTLLRTLANLPDRQRKRFYLGEYVDDMDGALWTIEVIEASRVVKADVPLMRRVVVAIDPSGTYGEEDTRSDAIGIAVAGLGVDNIVYVFEDATCQLPPAGWGYRAGEMAAKWGADAIVAEVNFGGAMVQYVIETTLAGGIEGLPIPPKVILVTASRGKAVRAEPVSALYDKGKVRHVGSFPELEDEMLSFSTAGYLGDKSPNRCDALVWAVTELAVGAGTLVFGTAEREFVMEPLRKTVRRAA